MMDDVAAATLAAHTEITVADHNKIRETIREKRTRYEEKINYIEVFKEKKDKYCVYVTFKVRNKAEYCQKMILVARSEGNEIRTNR